jgi:hypothetical protein
MRGDSLVLDDRFRTDPAFRLKTGPVWRLRRAFARSFRMGQLLDWCRQALIGRAPPRTVASALRDPTLVSPIYAPPADPRWQTAWRLTEKLIVTMRDEVGAHGARFLVAVLSTPIQVYPDPRVREEFLALHGFSDLMYPEERMAAFTSENGIDCVLLAPEMQRFAEEHGEYLHGFGRGIPPGFGHWNARGHRLAGELIARHLLARRPP